MSFEDEYNDQQGSSWSKPIEQIDYTIMKERKKHITVHTRENHEYHMKKFHRCVYCDNNIPLEEDKV